MTPEKLLKIVFVIDQYAEASNGTTMTVKRTVEALRRRGHTVEILSGDGEGFFGVHACGVRRTPILYGITKSQGMMLAKPRPSLMRSVIETADVVHILMPFKFGRRAKAIADALSVPATAAFHVQPENISSTLYLRRFKSINAMIYAWFRHFYNTFSHVHCPSAFIEDRLKTHHYTSSMHVISNGVSKRFIQEKAPERPLEKERYTLLMVGRFSREKRQDVLINAVALSAYKERIRLVLAGKGPWKDSLVSLAQKKNVKVTFRFFSQEALKEAMLKSDLYVHASDIEIEAIACIEAFATGLVPVIANSKESATKQFALSEENLFESDSPEALAQKIDYWLSHPKKRMTRSSEYVKYAKRFSLEHTALKLEAMFESAIDAFKSK